MRQAANCLYASIGEASLTKWYTYIFWEKAPPAVLGFEILVNAGSYNVQLTGEGSADSGTEGLTSSVPGSDTENGIIFNAMVNHQSTNFRRAIRF